jgi:hypothetical protein
MIGIVLVVALSLIFGWMWLKTIIGLLRQGPGDQVAWWAGSLAVVVLLGPFGALAYLLANPAFTDEEHPTR